MSNDFAISAMWDNAVRDQDAEQAREGFLRAKIATAGVWPFLAAAETEPEFDQRLALMADRIAASCDLMHLDAVVASYTEDWRLIAQARVKQTGLQVQAASKVADGQDAMQYPAVAMYTTAGDGGHFQVDHIASPKWLKTIHRGDDETAAKQAGREFATSQGMPFYVDGKRVEGRLAPGMEFYHVESGTWMPVFASAVDDVREQMKGLNEMCPGSGAHAGRGHTPSAPYGFHAKLSSKDGQCRNCGQKIPVVMGKKDHGYLMAHWPEGAGISDPKAAKLARFTAEQLSHEYSRFQQRPDWELEHVHHALSQSATSNEGNGPQEEARLEAVRRIKSERAQRVNAVFTPDPSDAQRYNRYPIPTQVPVGGNAVSPPAQMGPDGFPIDLSEGEQRSEVGYQRQLTPGAWTVTPVSEWPVRPNAADPTQQPRTAAEHVAGEGVVPTPGPNPNYFSQGSDGLAGPPSFPEDPAGGIEPKTDNRMDDFYGDVPPVQSGGSQQGPLDGQGYSRQGVEGSLQAEANQYIKQQDGKWVITQKGTGKVLSHHDSEEEANASFRAMEWSKHKGSSAPPPFAEAGAPHIAAFNDGHVNDYVNWAKGEGHDPDHVKTLKRYEQLPGIGKAHVNHIADQLYIGGGDSDWRKSAATDGRIVGHCDNCNTPVRYHTNEDGVDELRHLHNNHNHCSTGGGNAKTSGVVVAFYDPADPSVHVVANGMDQTNPNAMPQQPGQAGGGVSDTNVPQAPDASQPAQVTGVQRTADVLERPSPENPSGMGGDDYQARTWKGLVNQRPMQSAEDRNSNSPTLPQDPIKTLNTDGPRERSDLDEDETENQGADSREAALQEARR